MKRHIHFTSYAKIVLKLQKITSVNIIINAHSFKLYVFISKLNL